MIPQDTVNKILDSAQIVEVISDFVSLKRRGANFIACCPFHNEKTPSFYVSPSKGIYKCFGCGKSGTAVGFVMEHESMTYVEALKYLAKKYGIEVKEKEDSPEEIAARQRSESLYLVMDFAEKFFQESLKTPEGRSIGYAYFRSRGLEDSTIEKYGLGWSPKGGSVFSREALAKGYKEEFLTATGVSIKRNDGSLIDKFYDRVMFPIHSVSGRVIAFGGRLMSEGAIEEGDKKIPKYLNSPETEVFEKSRTLYGLNIAKRTRADYFILCEGYMDVIALHQAGFDMAIASLGTAFTSGHANLIRRYQRSKKVYLSYDSDEAGIKAALRAIPILRAAGITAKIINMDPYKDPDEFIKNLGKDEYVKRIENAEGSFFFEIRMLERNYDLKDPDSKTKFCIEIADKIALLEEEIERNNYTEAICEKYKLSANSLSKLVVKQAMKADNIKERTIIKSGIVLFSINKR